MGHGVTPACCFPALLDRGNAVNPKCGFLWMLNIYGKRLVLSARRAGRSKINVLVGLRDKDYVIKDSKCLFKACCLR